MNSSIPTSNLKTKSNYSYFKRKMTGTVNLNISIPKHLVGSLGSLLYPTLHLHTLSVLETGIHRCEQFPLLTTHALVPDCNFGSYMIKELTFAIVNQIKSSISNIMTLTTITDQRDELIALTCITPKHLIIRDVHSVGDSNILIVSVV